MAVEGDTPVGLVPPPCSLLNLFTYPSPDPSTGDSGPEGTMDQGEVVQEAVHGNRPGN